MNNFITTSLVLLLSFLPWPDAPKKECIPCGQVQLAQAVIDPFTMFAVAAAGAGDAAQDFDGTDDRFDKTNWFPADSDQGIISIWFRRDTSGVKEAIYSNSNARVQIEILSTDDIRILLRSTAGASLWFVDSGATTITDTNWHHILASWDLGGTPVSWFYLDDVDVEAITDLNTGTVEWTRTVNRVGALSSATPGSYLDGCLSEFYVQIGSFLDLDTTSNRRKFIDASGNPVDLGADGSTPTAVQPEVYLPGDDFTDNKGTNLNLAATGSPAACSNSPI